MELKKTRWQDLGILLLGGWLFISPWVMNYANMISATQNAYILGAVMVLLAILAVSIRKVWEEWINLAVGAWMIISPWVLKISAEKSVTLNAVIIGILAAGLAIWSMWKDGAFKKWSHDQWPAV